MWCGAYRQLRRLRLYMQYHLAPPPSLRCVCTQLLLATYQIGIDGWSLRLHSPSPSWPLPVLFWFFLPFPIQRSVSFLLCIPPPSSDHWFPFQILPPWSQKKLLFGYKSLWFLFIFCFFSPVSTVSDLSFLLRSLSFLPLLSFFSTSLLFFTYIIIIIMMFIWITCTLQNQITYKVIYITNNNTEWNI